ncbi:UNVERIFIED_CONTAM: hypothetical protein K2H54_043245 [Gekko kuhli]
MNPNTPFGGQPPSVVQAPPNKSSSGTTQVQPPLQFGQLSLFGPNSGGGVKNPGFAPSSDFKRTSELHGSSGQPLGFTQSYPFGHVTSFVATPTPTGPSIAGKQGFSFKLPTNLGASQASSAFGNTSGKFSSSVFSGPGFSFKIPKNAMSKTIFGIGSEPEKTQSQTIPNPFTFSLPGEGRPGRLAPFGVSQETSSSSATMPFSFSKPVSNSTTLPSSFPATLRSKTVEDDKKGPVNPFANPSSSFASFSFPSGGSSRPEHEAFVAPSEPVEKGMKRKEEKDYSPWRRDYDTADEPELQSRSDCSSNKHLARLTRPQLGGLFSMPFQDVLKSNKDNGCPKKEPKMERVSLESGELEQTSTAGGSQSGLAWVRPFVLQKEDKNKAKQKEKSSVSNPSHQNWNSGSTESLGGLPPSELKAFQCKNIPDDLNTKCVLENHFKKFVKIRCVNPNRGKKLAIVHCLDHSSALLARKKAKLLHKEIVTFWLKKKPKSSVSNPSHQNWDSGSTESLGGLPPSELRAFRCKNIPVNLNNRRVLLNHFRKFVKIHNIHPNRRNKTATVYCLDHSSAVLARKKAKLLHKEIVTFWQKKKPSYWEKGRMQIGCRNYLY